MPLYCLGLSHHTAPLALRERLAFSPADLETALAGCPRPADAELVVLSTCNRVEVYAHTASDDARFVDGLIGWLAEARRLPAAAFAPYLYRHIGRAAVRHLCRVAAGLESLVLGEAQIQGQVSDAHAAAARAGATGPVLDEVFRLAKRTGRRARHETQINRNPASVSSVAVSAAQETAGALDTCRVLVVGGGKIGTLALQALHEQGACEIELLNRTWDSARDQAEAWNARPLPPEALPDALARADLVITSAATTQPILTVALVRSAMSRRPDRPLTLIDVAVPRNVESPVGRLSHVHLIDIDDLQARAEAVVAERWTEVPAVEALVEEAVAAFEAWRREAEIAPLIADLRRKAETIRRHELGRLLEQLPNLDEDVQRRIEYLSRTLVNKLLHDPTTRLRDAAQNGDDTGRTRAVRELFDLSTETTPAS